MIFLQDACDKIAPLDASWLERAQKRHDQLTKPPRSLGRLEEIAVRLCAIQHTDSPRATPSRIVIFAADHGVAHEGVSAYPPQVTAQMVANFRRGGAAINALSRAAQAQLHVVDVGVEGDEIEVDIEVDADTNANIEYSMLKYSSCRVRNGTRSMTRGAAMTHEEALSAIATGIAQAESTACDNVAVVGIGEMGIGNTTSASALTSLLSGLSPQEVTGRGTGIDDATWKHKIEIIERAIQINDLQPLGEAPTQDRVLDALASVGGLEIAAMCGFCLGAAQSRRAVIVDGFIATCAAALAVRFCPDVKSYLFASHRSTEIGHAALLRIIEQEPLLDLGMRLGEGSGAALCLPILAGAVAVFNEMTTFENAGISGAADISR